MRVFFTSLSLSLSLVFSSVLLLSSLLLLLSSLLFPFSLLFFPFSLLFFSFSLLFFPFSFLLDVQRVDDKADGSHVVREQLPEILPLDVEKEQGGDRLEVVALKFFCFFLNKEFRVFSLDFISSFFLSFLSLLKKTLLETLFSPLSPSTHRAPARTPGPWAS